MLRLETRKSGTTEVREVVETKDGDLDWLISVNGEPLPEDQRRERGRGLQRLISNPAELKKSKRETDEDQARSQRLLKMLPDALVFEYGEQRGDLVELKFKPNSYFRPPSHESAVVRAMEGVLWVNGRQKRLVEISGHLTRPVKFGGGLLGHLDAGGHFYVKQEEVQPGYWELVVLDVDMKGKALFFKTIGVQEEMKRSMFRRVRDDLTAAQGANLLYQQLRTTSKISFKGATNLIVTAAGSELSAIAEDNDPATIAALSTSYDVAVDASGNIYIADPNNDVIREVTVSSKLITTIAGVGDVPGYSGHGENADAALLSAPRA